MVMFGCFSDFLSFELVLGGLNEIVLVRVISVYSLFEHDTAACVANHLFSYGYRNIMN